MIQTTLNPALTGTWNADSVHSTVGFKVAYMGLSLFGAEVKDLDATLEVSEDKLSLKGKIAVEGIQINEPNFKGHLLSEEFFHAEAHPYLTFDSEELSISEDGAVTGSGILNIKGIDGRVDVEGVLEGPITDSYGNQRLGLNLHTTIDRTEFGLLWNTPLPSGDKALANDVKVEVRIQAVRA